MLAKQQQRECCLSGASSLPLVERYNWLMSAVRARRVSLVTFFSAKESHSNKIKVLTSKYIFWCKTIYKFL